MVIDTSALLAVLLQEPDASRVAQAIEAGSPRLLSAANLLEASIVIESRKGEAGTGHSRSASPRDQTSTGRGGRANLNTAISGFSA